MIKKVYHGSTVCVSEPCLQPLTRRLDFGSGFYTTSDLEQARRWAKIKQRRLMADLATVSIYDATPVFEADSLRIKHFKSANEEWLNFVMVHRMGGDLSETSYDVICGPVANDTLYETLTLYERGILTHAETVVRLRTHKLADQIVFVTDLALSLLTYVGAEEVNDG
ncbi:MAG: DUF3990 domain-containing protein [Kiritimatiellae bacterium]|jgi:hypothetical protein|nr:DUF3990 domain-containing protein [Kiritimatiellia bacterium]